MKAGLCSECAIAFNKRQTGEIEARWIIILFNVLDQIIQLIIRCHTKSQVGDCPCCPGKHCMKCCVSERYNKDRFRFEKLKYIEINFPNKCEQNSIWQNNITYIFSCNCSACQEPPCSAFVKVSSTYQIGEEKLLRYIFN